MAIELDHGSGAIGCPMFLSVCGIPSAMSASADSRVRHRILLRVIRW